MIEEIRREDSACRLDVQVKNTFIFFTVYALWPLVTFFASIENIPLAKKVSECSHATVHIYISLFKDPIKIEIIV